MIFSFDFSLFFHSFCILNNVTYCISKGIAWCLCYCECVNEWCQMTSITTIIPKGSLIIIPKTLFSSEKHSEKFWLFSLRNSFLFVNKKSHVPFVANTYVSIWSFDSKSNIFYFEIIISATPLLTVKASSYVIPCLSFFLGDLSATITNNAWNQIP